MIVVEQTDIARLSDTAVKLTVISLTEAAEKAGDHPMADLWRQFAVALIRAHRLRRATFERMVAVYELDAENDPDDDAEGELVLPPGHDEVTDALDALRRKIRKGPV